MDFLVDYILNFYGPTPYLIIFFILMLCGLGLPIPEDVTLIVAGLISYYGVTSLGVTIGVSIVGVLIGDIIIFYLGAHFGRRLTKKWLFHKLLPDERLNEVKEKFHKKGNKLLFFARFMPGFRAPIFFSAGTLHIPFRTFISYDGVAALISVPFIVGMVYRFGDELDWVLQVIKKVEHGILIGIFSVFFIIIAKWYITHRKIHKNTNKNLILFVLSSLLLSPNMMAGDPPEVSQWCKEVRSSLDQLKWKLDPCEGLQWRVSGKSAMGRPLVYAEFGNQMSTNTTLIFSMVHGDEVTPLYLAIELAHWLKENPSELIKGKVVIAPLINPDGFFKNPRTRVNAHGVDVNRNFQTKDWKTSALKLWKHRYRSDKRRFPAFQPDSEPETLFQEQLISLVKPQKILSIHAPLNFLDYDGPTVLSLAKFPRDYVHECVKLRTRLKAISGGFFPGSLGNYAGQERGIPTLTLELPSADSRYALKYWTQFKTGIHTMIEFKVPDYASRIFVRNGG